MLSNYYTLRLLAWGLQERLPHRAIRSLFTQEKDELVIAVQGAPHLVVSCRSSENTCFLHPRYTRARTNTLSVMPELEDRQILRTALDPMDRIIRISLDDGSCLALRLYRPKPNVLLADAGGTVISAFRSSRTERGTLLPGRGEEKIHDLAAFRDALASTGESSLQGVLQRHFPELGAVFLSEVLFRAGLSADSMPSHLTSDATERLTSALAALFTELSHPHPTVYLREDGSVEVLSPIALQHLAALPVMTFDDIHDAVRHVVYRRRSGQAFDNRHSALLARLKEQLRRSHRATNAVRATLASGSRAEEYETAGKLLLGHMQAIPAGAQAADLFDGTRGVNVRLDPRLDAVQNAEAYFRKAKHARASVVESRRRLDGLARQIELGEQLLTHLQEARTMEDLARRMKERAADLRALGVSPQVREQEPPPFRTFSVEGGFEVWAGKNSANNDLLTFKHARPDDLWFHARGGSGSHVILRVRSAPGEPGKRAKEQAASIAAYYSALRGARMVPVSVTKRKYVRKPRGAPAGTVAIEREKVIFAEPALPPVSQATGPR